MSFDVTVSADGYYFLQEAWKCSETKQLNWNYYPPNRFKILLYYPETDTYTVSEICERYAFDSYFKVTMDGLEIDFVDADVYNYTWEMISFACRVVVTLVLELAIAWLFGLREKKQIGVIFLVNAVTQIELNAALNLINYKYGAYSFVFCYVLLEILVFAMEAAVYLVLLRKCSAKPISNKKILVYTLTANAASFVGGLVIARIVPGIF